MRFHPEVLLSGCEGLPTSRSTTRRSRRLGDLDLMLMVSSTAALEAVGAGCALPSLPIWMCANSWATTSSSAPACSAPSTSWRSTTSASPTGAGSRTISSTPTGSRPRSRSPTGRRNSPSGLIAAVAPQPGPPLFASQHELITYRKQTTEHGTPAIGERAARVRAIARWILPYGIQPQLRQAVPGGKPYAGQPLRSANVRGGPAAHDDAEMTAEEAPPSILLEKLPAGRIAESARFRDAICQQFPPESRSVVSPGAPHPQGVHRDRSADRSARPADAAAAGGLLAASHHDYPAFRVEFRDPQVRNRVLMPFQTAAARDAAVHGSAVVRLWTITWPESRCGSRPAGFH